MRLFLAGQRTFGRAVLGALVDAGHELAGVSAPPAHDGREDPLWGLAGDYRLPRVPAGMLFAGTLPAGVDLIVTAHAHDFIGRATRARARLGALGYHPSLLPLHRGRDAIRWTIHMGERVTGGSVYWLSDAVDAGPIAAQGWCFVRPGESAGELWRRALLPLGLRLLTHVVAEAAAGRVVAVPQDERLATWEPSFGRPPLRRPDLPMLRADNAAPAAVAVTAEPAPYGTAPLLGSPEWELGPSSSGW